MKSNGILTLKESSALYEFRSSKSFTTGTYWVKPYRSMSRRDLSHTKGRGLRKTSAPSRVSKRELSR